MLILNGILCVIFGALLNKIYNDFKIRKIKIGLVQEMKEHLKALEAEKQELNWASSVIEKGSESISDEDKRKLADVMTSGLKVNEKGEYLRGKVDMLEML